MNTLPSVRRLLLTLVLGCVLPMLLLALSLIWFQPPLDAQGSARPLAIAVAVTLVVAMVTLQFAWRLAGSISDAMEALTAAVRAAGHASLNLPPPRFVEAARLGQAFAHATTALQDADEALREREARLRTILETAHDAIVTADEEGSIVMFNHEAERMFGLAEDQAIGTPLDRFVPMEKRGRHLAWMRAMAPDVAGPRRMGPARVVRALRADGSRFPVSASISCGTAGTRRFFTAILREVAEGRLDLDVTAAHD